MNNKKLDAYRESFTNENLFLQSVQEMDENSRWVEDISSKSFQAEALDSSAAATAYADVYQLDKELALDTAKEDSSQLVLKYRDVNGEITREFVRDTACNGLVSSVAGMGGRNTPKLTATNLARCINIFISDEGVKERPCLILRRYGKISAIHSDADSVGYEIMPIGALLDIAQKNLSETFGELRFISGENEHGSTTCLWALPDVQNDIMVKYQEAIRGSVSTLTACNYMPAVRFRSSDTSASCATLTPVFLSGRTEFHFIEGISVKHTRTRGKNGMQLFDEKSKKLYAVFQKSMETIAKLAQIRIYNPENTVISLCNQYDIPKKYGDYAREIVSNFSNAVSAHDIYLVLSGITANAKEKGASPATILSLTEKLAKIPSCNWRDHDVGGVVAWGNKT